MDLVKVRDKETGHEFGMLRRWVDHDQEVIGGPEDLTAVQIAGVLSSDAENDNYHDFVGFFERLAGIAIEQAGEEAAARIMLEIAKGGGFRL